VNQRVFDLAVVGTDLYATGEFTQAGGQPANRIARWDGTNWHALGSGLSNIGHAVGAQSGKLWVGGEFKIAGLAGSSRIARWTAPVTTDVPGASTGSPRLALRSAFPNPSSRVTLLTFDLPRGAYATVVLRALGQ
jgi:hypothetical protein